MNVAIALAAFALAAYFFLNSANAALTTGLSMPENFRDQVRAMIVQNNPDGYFDVQTIMAQIKTESNFDPRAIGVAGEIGLMQIMPATAQDMGTDPATLYDPAINVATGMRYLRWIRDFLRREFGREPSTLEIFSGYNKGVGNVLRGNLALGYTAKIEANRLLV